MGKLAQIDGGLIKTVYGTDPDQNVFRVKSKSYPIPEARLSHVSVGQGGIWGVNSQGQIMFAGPKSGWQVVPGSLIQVDSGPAGVVYGVNKDHKIYFREGILPSVPMGTDWREVPGRLKYVSCGLFGCWGVNKHNHVYFRNGVTSTKPLGSKWTRIEDPVKLTQIEAGPGGIAAGLLPDGTVMIRTGVTRDVPYGEAWEKLDTFNTPVIHVTVALDKIYIITQHGDVYESLLEKSSDTKPPTGSEGSSKRFLFFRLRN